MHQGVMTPILIWLDGTVLGTAVTLEGGRGPRTFRSSSHKKLCSFTNRLCSISTPAHQFLIRPARAHVRRVSHKRCQKQARVKRATCYRHAACMASTIRPGNL